MAQHGLLFRLSQRKNSTCIAEDRQGRIWVGTDDSGVAVFNQEGGRRMTAAMP
ncbi:MAG: two-component regulator propeller domain-containing protein [Akkermansia sp.]